MCYIVAEITGITATSNNLLLKRYLTTGQVRVEYRNLKKREDTSVQPFKPLSLLKYLGDHLVSCSVLSLYLDFNSPTQEAYMK